MAENRGTNIFTPDFDSDASVTSDENVDEVEITEEEGESEPRKKKRRRNIYNAFMKVHRDCLTEEYKRRGICSKELNKDITNRYKLLSSLKKLEWMKLLKKRSFSLSQPYVEDWFLPNETEESIGNEDNEDNEDKVENNSKDEVSEDEIIHEDAIEETNEVSEDENMRCKVQMMKRRDLFSFFETMHEDDIIRIFMPFNKPGI